MGRRVRFADAMRVVGRTGRRLERAARYGNESEMLEYFVRLVAQVNQTLGLFDEDLRQEKSPDAIGL